MPWMVVLDTELRLLGEQTLEHIDGVLHTLRNTGGMVIMKFDDKRSNVWS